MNASVAAVDGPLGDRSPAGQPQLNLAWAWFAWPAALYGLFFTALRPFNELPYLIVIALAVPACLGVRGLVLLPGQALLIFLSVIYLLLSLFDEMPRAWTVYHDNYAALRHWSWIVTIPILTSAFFTFLLRYREAIIGHALKICAVVYVARSVSLLFDRTPEFYDDIFLGRFSLYSPDNETIPVFMLLMIAAFRGDRIRAYQIAILALMVPVSTSAGTFLSSIASFGLRFIRKRRLALNALFVALLAFLVITPYYFSEVFDLDGNSGVRAIFWRDTQRALVDTWGVGVGFGTEYITNWFGDVGRLEWNLTPEDATDRLFISNHSTFYDVALRMGLVGLGLFLLMINGLVRAAASPTSAPMCALLLISCSVVPAMTAVDTQIGISLLIAWLLVEQARPGGAEEQEGLRQ